MINTNMEIKKINLSVSSMFGIGHLRFCAGTVCSLLTIPAWTIVRYITHNMNVLYCVATVLCMFGIYVIKDKHTDNSIIVFDEFIGMFIALTIQQTLHIKNIIICFSIFRLFDILKPYPISLIDSKMKNFVGIILDDIISAISAGLLTNIIFTTIH